MELVVKITGKCNFACNFCITGKKAPEIKHLEHLPQELKDVIDVLKPDTIIVNGGEPLLSGKEFFYELLDYYKHGYVSIITNLKDFVARPDYWTPLFKNERIMVTTSFQYGEDRRWNKGTPYTEQMFKDTCALFKEKVGYVPTFISVVTKDNQDMALQHAYLAKELGTQCKINPVLPYGLSNYAFPKYKMVDIWLKIKELGLEEYCNADIQFYKGGCSFNTNLFCTSSIRIFWLDVNGKIHYSSCDNCWTLGDIIPLDKTQLVQSKMTLDPKTFISGEKCLSCKLCRFCNACKANREANRNDPNYCSEMKKRLDKILDSGWFI